MARFGRTDLRSGTITVGPVTTTNAPKSAAKPGLRSTNRYAAPLATAQVTSIPTETSRQITWLNPRTSAKRSVRLPSKRITATANDTIGKSRSPKSASGSRMPVIGPATIPSNKRNRIAGMLVRHASHCAKMPLATMPERVRKTVSFIRIG